MRDGVPFDLAVEDIEVPVRCPYLGIRLAVGRGRHHDASPSLDRLIPELGYVAGNVLVVSMRANSLKRDASLRELERLTAALRRLVKAGSEKKTR